VTRLWAGQPAFDSQKGLKFYVLATVSTLALGPIQPPIQGVPRALTPEVKWPGCEADQSLPSTAKVRNAWCYTSTPPTCLHNVELN